MIAPTPLHSSADKLIPDSPVRRLEELLGLDPIKAPQPIDVDIRRLTCQPEEDQLPAIPAATPDDQLAREAVAEVECEDGWPECARARLRGYCDGDTEHRIALAAIRMTRERPDEIQREREAGQPSLESK